MNQRPLGYEPNELPLLYSGMGLSQHGMMWPRSLGESLWTFPKFHAISITPFFLNFVPGLSPICPIIPRISFSPACVKPLPSGDTSGFARSMPLHMPPVSHASGIYAVCCTAFLLPLVHLDAMHPAPARCIVLPPPAS